jgi:hypothetical protein
MNYVKQISVIAVVLLLVGCKPSPAQKSDTESMKSDEKQKTTMQDSAKLYQAKSGKIVYKLSGAQEGEETLYFTDWGKKQATFRQAKFTGIAGQYAPAENSITINEGTITTTVDLNAKTATRVDAGDLMDSMKLNNKDLSQMSEAMLKAMDAKKEGTKTIAGQTCDVMKMEKLGTQVCTTQGLVLEVSASTAGIAINKVATEVDLNTTVSADKFTVPDGIEVKTQDMGKLKEILDKL